MRFWRGVNVSVIRVLDLKFINVVILSVCFCVWRGNILDIMSYEIGLKEIW